MEIKENDFEINIDNINVEEIMAKIRQNIKDKGYVEEEKINNFDFTPKISEEDNFRYDIDVLNRVWNINLEREIATSPFSCCDIIAGLMFIFFASSF